MSIGAFVKGMADRLGFAAVGITAADPVDGFASLKGAIASERIAGMAWLARDVERRCDPRSLLPNARSVLCCALAYGERGIEGRHPEAKPKDPLVPVVRGDPSRPLRMASPAVARFARGAEYHDSVRKRLEKLWVEIQQRFPAARAKICVDTSPLLEKALAHRAGIGWIGKHTILLNERLGSWFVLGEIITDLKLEPDSPGIDRCGDCRACLDACPTGALTGPRCLDARRCIAYLSIEHRGPIPEEMRSFVPEGTYGCDRCQEACPYNR